MEASHPIAGYVMVCTISNAAACKCARRPEAVESFFVMWFYTRDPKWREYGWKVCSLSLQTDLQMVERGVGRLGGTYVVDDIDEFK